MVKNYVNTLSHFHAIPERNGQTDRQICYINIARQYADARQKNAQSSYLCITLSQQTYFTYVPSCEDWTFCPSRNTHKPVRV